MAVSSKLKFSEGGPHPNYEHGPILAVDGADIARRTTLFTVTRTTLALPLDYSGHMVC